MLKLTKEYTVTIVEQKEFSCTICLDALNEDNAIEETKRMWREGDLDDLMDEEGDPDLVEAYCE